MKRFRRYCAPNRENLTIGPVEGEAIKESNQVQFNKYHFFLIVPRKPHCKYWASLSS
jgi:hypothetical protein